MQIYLGDFIIMKRSFVLKGKGADVVKQSGKKNPFGPVFAQSRGFCQLPRDEGHTLLVHGKGGQCQIQGV